MYRSKIIDCLVHNEILSKLIRLIIALTWSNNKARMNINNNELSEEFKIESGVKQVDPLAITLVCILIETVLKQLNWGGNISTRLKHCIAYADGILLMARTRKSLFEIYEQLKQESLQYGLIINTQKEIFKMSGE